MNQDGEGLAGAEFVIYNSDGLYLQEDYSWGDEFSAWTFVSDGDGYFEIKGLAYGNYYLKETKAPEVNGVQYEFLMMIMNSQLTLTAITVSYLITSLQDQLVLKTDLKSAYLKRVVWVVFSFQYYRTWFNGYIS